MFRSIALEWFEARTTDFTEKHRGTVMYHLEKYIFPVDAPEYPRHTRVSVPLYPLTSGYIPAAFFVKH